MLDRLPQARSVEWLAGSCIEQLGGCVLHGLHQESGSTGAVATPQHFAELPQPDPERLTPCIVASAGVPLRKERLHQSRASMSRRL